MNSTRSNFVFALLLTAGSVALIGACGRGTGGTALPDGWGVARLIETNNAGSARDPEIAVYANGNAVAVWSQSDGMRGNIWASHYNSTTGTWDLPTLIETDDASNALAPKVAVGLDGNAVAVWSQSDGLRFNVWANFYNGTTGVWGTAQLLEVDNAGDAVNPDIAVDASGNAIVVWCQFDGVRFNIWANHFNSATRTWGSAQLVESENLGTVELSPQVAADSDGGAFAVWAQSDGVRFNIWANRFNVSSGTWGNARLIEVDNTGDARDPQLAGDRNGNVMTSWVQFDGMRFNVWASRYTKVVDAWDAPQLLEIGDGDAFVPQLAADPMGNFICVWSQSDGVSSSIWASRYDASTGQWGVPLSIETGNGGAFGPSVAGSSNGNAVVVWHQYNGVRYSIMANHYLYAVGAWASAQEIELLGDTGNAYGARVAGTDNGTHAVWYKFDGSRSDVWSNTFRY